MSQREFVALGTASQVPTRYRNHNGAVLLWDGVGLLFDPGEGTQRQMIRSGVTASQLHHIFISHFHGDHCLGFASVVQRISLDGVPRQITAHYPQSGQVYYDRLRHASIFHDRARVKPCPITGGGTVYEGAAFSIRAEPLQHGVECFGFRLQEPDSVTMNPEALDRLGVQGADRARLRDQGQLEVTTAAGTSRTVRLEEVSARRPGQSVAVVMDTRLCDTAFSLARGVDLLICESTYLSEHTQEAHDHGHLTAAQAATIARDAGARRLVLTHFSQRYPRVEPFLEEASRIHPDVVAAKDGLRVPVPARRKVD